MRTKTPLIVDKDKSSRAHASQFFVAGELCRRGWIAVVTLGNSPNTDILCSNKAGTKFVHIQVKTFVPGNRSCSVGSKAEKDFGENFLWILGGIPRSDSKDAFEYYVIPAKDMAKNVKHAHKRWLKTPGKRGQAHRATMVRAINLPPRKSFAGWDIKEYRDRWDLIGAKLES